MAELVIEAGSTAAQNKPVEADTPIDANDKVGTLVYQIKDNLLKPLVPILERINPNHITIVGAVLGSISPWILTHADNISTKITSLLGKDVDFQNNFKRSLIGLGVGFTILGYTCDSLDGTIARLTGQTSDLGEALDSICDRFADASSLAAILHKAGLDQNNILEILSLGAGIIGLGPSQLRAYLDQADIPTTALPIGSRAPRAVLGLVAMGDFALRDLLGEKYKLKTLPVRELAIGATTLFSIITVAQRYHNLMTGLNSPTEQKQARSQLAESLENMLLLITSDEPTATRYALATLQSIAADYIPNKVSLVLGSRRSELRSVKAIISTLRYIPKAALAVPKDITLPERRSLPFRRTLIISGIMASLALGIKAMKKI